MKKVDFKVADTPSSSDAIAIRPKGIYLVPPEPAEQLYLPKLDHATRLVQSAELGIIALGRSGSVVEMNLAAHELIAAKDGLTLSGRSLEATTPSENVSLTDAIRASLVYSEDHASGVPPVSMLRISRTRSSSLLVGVVPSERRLAENSFGELAALVLISDPDRPLHESVRMLCELYGLTPGETRLTEHLIDGFTLAEIAEIMNLKSSTVRVYLKQIFVKTGVKRQAMLIHLFLTSRIPFNFPDVHPIVSRAARASTMVPDRISS